jgi:ribosome maturation factor RimP
MQPVAGRVQALLEPAVNALGYELLGIEYMPQGRHSLLRMYIDAEDGIGLEDCERVSHQVSGILDVEDVVHGQYTLEVSSPGLDRPLFTQDHFRKYLGQTVKLRLSSPLDGRRKFSGVISAVEDDDAVVVTVDNETVTIPWNLIEKANLVPEW